MEIFSQLIVKMGCNYFPIISRSSYSRAGNKAEGVKLFPLYFPRETLFPARTSCCRYERSGHWSGVPVYNGRGKVSN